MKIFIFIMWMFFTLILVLSIIGLLVIAPQVNHTAYYKSPEDLRSTWMRIGYGLYKSLINGW